MSNNWPQSSFDPPCTSVSPYLCITPVLFPLTDKIRGRAEKSILITAPNGDKTNFKVRIACAGTENRDVGRCSVAGAEAGECVKEVDSEGNSEAGRKGGTADCLVEL